MTVLHDTVYGLPTNGHEREKKERERRGRETVCVWESRGRDFCKTEVSRGHKSDKSWEREKTEAVGRAGTGFRNVLLLFLLLFFVN